MLARHTANPRGQATNVATVFASHEKAALNQLKSPLVNDSLGVVYVTLTLLIMAYSYRFNVWPILLFLGMWSSVIVLKGLRLLRITPSMLICMSMPLLCATSTLWSPVASKTLYLGTAFLALNLCAIIIARAVSYRAFIYGLSIGILMILLFTLLNGSYIFDVMNNRHTLVGFFSGKNQVGFVAAFGIVIAAIFTLSPVAKLAKLVVGGSLLLIALYCLRESHSGTSIVSALVAILAASALYFLARMPSAISGALAIVILLIVIFTAIGSSTFNGKQTIFRALGKDNTLTGRTYLWEEGKKIGWETPILGQGYSAFWIHGNPLAERYWQEFFIADRSGFHFHSTYVQVFVDLGMIGLALLSLIIALNVGMSAHAYLKNPTSAETLLLFSLSVMFFVRSWVEVDFFHGPFGIGTLLFYFILPRLGHLRQTSAPDHNPAVIGRFLT